MDQDPVCGMKLRPGQEAASITYQDHTYHFCSSDCKREFERHPKQYITAGAASSR
ncbi:MAG: YHS domain-containing protein [Chloroflexota bacterium]|nr:MAG: YHS domain-containing protein [Chloroflexota bacterium]